MRDFQGVEDVSMNPGREDNFLQALDQDRDGLQGVMKVWENFIDKVDL